jgi:hypothetical protein
MRLRLSSSTADRVVPGADRGSSVGRPGDVLAPCR